MRLMNASNFRLETFNRSETPMYAILSHVWHKEEVIFQDIGDLPRARRMSGFEKISLSCRQARQDGLQYVWIDTCCIDKSSSAELSEAINSMFKWYQDATVCYAYLSTTRTLENSEDFASEFHNSRWFTRGWTLQELIAPKHVKFYGNSWKYLGSKFDLGEQISRITQIPTRLLYNTSTLYSYSVAKRMSWASGRNTTRLEDEAYSLLGIFGVNMPLLYGEGRKAFIRLQEEIIKVSDDESVFVWKGTFLRKELKLDMLAPEPQAFADSGNVASLPTIGQSSQYAVTNKGLQIHLPILEQETDNTPHDCVGILNCHEENDFTGYYGIRLRFLNTESDGARHYSRLDVCKVSEESANSAIPKTIIIRNFYDPTSASKEIYIQLQQTMGLHNKFLVTPFMPIIFDGDCSWNSSTSVLRARMDSWLPIYLKLGFLLYNETLDWGFIIAYCVHLGGIQGLLRIVETTFEKSHETWLKCMKGFGMGAGAYESDVMYPSLALTGTAGPFEGDWEIRAAVSKEQRLKLEVLNLHIKLLAKPKASTSTESVKPEESKSSSYTCPDTFPDTIPDTIPDTLTGTEIVLGGAQQSIRV